MNMENTMTPKMLPFVFRLLLLMLAVAAFMPVQADERVTYTHFDMLGSTIARSNDVREMVWDQDYQPYGDRVIADYPINSVGYAGKVHYDNVGLSYYGARWYDPSIGRFMGVDPQPFQQDNIHSFNRYAYANNNPYKYVDPDGELPIFALGFFAADVYLNYQDTGNLTEALGASLIGMVNPFKKLGVVKKVGGVVTKKTKRNKVEPHPEAEGAHTTWKTDPQTGKITRHETYTPNPRNPSGFDKVQSTDLTGAPHINKKTGDAIPTPHTQGKSIPGGVRPATPDEIPR